MRSAIIALLALSALPVTAIAQTRPQTAAVESAAASAVPAASRTDGITRDQYVKRAQERAEKRSVARFDRMDANHDGVLDQAERQAWRNQHPRRAAAHPAQPKPQ